MDENDKLRLRGNFRYIVGQIRVADIRDFMFEKGILNDDDFEELEPGRNGKTERNNVRTLLKILFKKGPNAYAVFCDALNASEYPFVVQKLQDTDLTKVKVESQDELDSFLNEEGKLVELQRQLWSTVENLERYKRDVDHLRAEHQEMKTSKEDLERRFVELGSQLKDNGNSQEYIVKCLEDYMVHAQQDAVDSHVGHSLDTTWSNKPVSPNLPRSGSKQEMARIAVALGHDIVYYLTCSPDAMPPLPNRYAKTMRRTVGLLIEKQQSTFDNFIENLSLSDANGFEMLHGVAEEMFRVGENNWGRVVALYAFGGFVAKHAMKNKMQSITIYIGDYIGKYVATNLSEWIDRKGGWEDFENFFADKDEQGFGWKGLFLTAVGLGALISIVSVKGSQ